MILKFSREVRLYLLLQAPSRRRRLVIIIAILTLQSAVPNSSLDVYPNHSLMFRDQDIHLLSTLLLRWIFLGLLDVIWRISPLVLCARVIEIFCCFLIVSIISNCFVILLRFVTCCIHDVFKIPFSPSARMIQDVVSNIQVFTP